MNILYCASEATPLIKTGGLADVAGSLPGALRTKGIDCRLALPAYPDAIANAGELKLKSVIGLEDLAAEISIYECETGRSKVPTYLIDAPGYFDRHGNPYVSPEGTNWPDNADRFGLFCRIIAQIAMDECNLGWKPDLINTNDWQTGLVAPLLHDRNDRPATVFTIHNLAYQGLFEADTFQRLRLPDNLWSLHGLEFYGQLSFIKGGIVYSDRVNTVSQTYADEIRSPTLGYGLEELLMDRGENFSGILNGIDNELWNPATDKQIVSHYDENHFDAKSANKAALQQRFDLDTDPDRPLFGYIGRLVEQKGVDLIMQVLPGILDAGGQVVMLGSGNPELEHQLRRFQTDHHSRVGVTIGYNEQLSHQIEASADVFLMPSRFEPCGLNQLYSLRYGTIPIVRRTGGLADTVVDPDDQDANDLGATGFVFDQPDAASLWSAVDRAIRTYYQDRDTWREIALRGMRQDYSWQSSAENYLRMYQSALADIKS